MKVKVLSLLSALLLAAPARTLSDTGAPPAACDWHSIASNFNALVFGDFTASGGDTEYRLAVGGNASFVNGYSFTPASARLARPWPPCPTAGS